MSVRRELLDFTVRVDRSIKPAYPDWVKRVEHSELERAGPAEYDLRKVQRWIHPKQEGDFYTKNKRSRTSYPGVDTYPWTHTLDPKMDSYPRGWEIHRYLELRGELTSCLNLQDALAIQKKGLATFDFLVTYFWGSVVAGHGEYSDPLYVPFLARAYKPIPPLPGRNHDVLEVSGHIRLGWAYLGNTWYANDRAARWL